MIAFFRGEPVTEVEGPDREDHIDLLFFGHIIRDGRIISREELRAVYEDMVDDAP